MHKIQRTRKPTIHSFCVVVCSGGDADGGEKSVPMLELNNNVDSHNDSICCNEEDAPTSSQVVVVERNENGRGGEEEEQADGADE